MRIYHELKMQALASNTLVAMGSTPAHGSSGISTGTLVAALVAALVVVGCAAWARARAQAYEPHWTLSLRHAVAEAGFRASSTWAEFSDWVRSGR